MKRIILHIGSPKCGSSFLQNTLYENRERLAAAGIVLPNSGLSTRNLRFGARHLTFSRALELEGADGPVARSLRAEIDRSPGGVFVITQEGIAEENDPATVRTALEGYDLTAIVYGRNPIDLIESRYRQWVQFGYDRSIIKYARSQARKINLPGLIELWRKHLGVGRVIYRSIDHLPGRTNLAADMFACVGVDAPELVPSASTNERYPNAVILLHLVANVRKRLKQPVGPLRPGFDYASNEGRLLTDEECREIEAAYGPAYVALLKSEGIADGYVSRSREAPWDAGFFDPATREAAEHWIAQTHKPGSSERAKRTGDRTKRKRGRDDRVAQLKAQLASAEATIRRLERWTPGGLRERVVRRLRALLGGKAPPPGTK